MAPSTGWGPTPPPPPPKLPSARDLGVPIDTLQNPSRYSSSLVVGQFKRAPSNRAMDLRAAFQFLSLFPTVAGPIPAPVFRPRPKMLPRNLSAPIMQRVHTSTNHAPVAWGKGSTATGTREPPYRAELCQISDLTLSCPPRINGEGAGRRRPGPGPPCSTRPVHVNVRGRYSRSSSGELRQSRSLVFDGLRPNLWVQNSHSPRPSPT